MTGRTSSGANPADRPFVLALIAAMSRPIMFGMFAMGGIVVAGALFDVDANTYAKLTVVAFVAMMMAILAAIRGVET